MLIELNYTKRCVIKPEGAGGSYSQLQLLWEAEIRKIKTPGQPGEIVLETPTRKLTRTKYSGVWVKWYSNCFANTNP
jgi:hypothetical protein